MNLRWNGGKARAARDLWSLAPSRVAEYREPFAGNASMLWQIPTNVKRWINDIDPSTTRHYAPGGYDPETSASFFANY